MFYRICVSSLVAGMLSAPLLVHAQSGEHGHDEHSQPTPSVMLVLAGAYAGAQQDPSIPATGFAMNPHPFRERGFGLGESELALWADIDAQYRGKATFALDPAGGLSVENAYVQNTVLPHGLSLQFGRFFSELGYLNAQHAHVWDFADQPLVYASFWGNQLGEDGVQLKWQAPTATFIEFGAEMGKGRGFPGSGTAQNGSGASILFVHIGNIEEAVHSWRAGISLHRTRATNRASDNVPDMNGNLVSNAFSGNSRTAGLDLVWKYAPDGDVHEPLFKLQTELFRRTEQGMLTYDIAATNITDSYAVTQSGWYVQGVYQFSPNWRSGLRHDRLDPGPPQIGVANAGNVISLYAFTPKRTTWMLEYAPSERSHLRLQWARDESRRGMKDNLVILQYVMSLGAHSVHPY